MPRGVSSSPEWQCGITVQLFTLKPTFPGKGVLFCFLSSGGPSYCDFGMADAEEARKELEKKEAMKNAGSDILNLMATSRVAEEIQVKFYTFGLDCVPAFAAMFTSPEEVRKVMKKDFGLDEEASLVDRMKVSRVIVAWQAAQTKTTKIREMEGEAEVRGEPKKLPQPDYQAMKTGFEEKYWEIEDADAPSLVFMQKRLDMIEKASFGAESLSEVLDATTEDLPCKEAPSVDAKGYFISVKVGPRLSMPSNSEQLRQRIETWGTSWIWASLLHTNRAYLKNLTPRLFETYGKHMVGPKVLGLVSSGEIGAPVSRDTWLKVLNYEYEVRKYAMKLMQKGTPFIDALPAAYNDPIIKATHFTDPVVHDRKRPMMDSPDDEEEDWRKTRRGAEGAGAKGSGKKGGGKGKKGGGKSKAGKRGAKGAWCEHKAPDGRRICYAFNNPREGCTNKACKFAHICGRCYAEGKPLFECDHKK